MKKAPLNILIRRISDYGSALRNVHGFEGQIPFEVSSDAIKGIKEIYKRCGEKVPTSQAIEETLNEW